MGEPTFSYIVENDRLFKQAIDRALLEVNDLKLPFNQIAFDWYKVPKEGTFVYTVVLGNPQTGAGDFIQYDAVNSIPLEWPETVLNYFLWKLATRYGIFIGNTFLAQFAKQQEDA